MKTISGDDLDKLVSSPGLTRLISSKQSKDFPTPVHSVDGMYIIGFAESDSLLRKRYKTITKLLDTSRGIDIDS